MHCITYLKCEGEGWNPYFVSSCSRDSYRIAVGIKHLDSIIRLFTPDGIHAEEAQGSWGRFHNLL